MASGNMLTAATHASESTSGNKLLRRGRPPVQLSAPVHQVLAEYRAALELAPLEPTSRANYLSRVHGFLTWLSETDVDGDPLTDPAARDWAVRDYRGHLKAVRKSAPATINNTLAAPDDSYSRRGLGAALHRGAGNMASRSRNRRIR